MSPSNSGDGFSQAPEEFIDEVINSRDTDDIMPKNCIFDEYVHNAKSKSIEIFDLKRSYERPYVNYYIVITPYGNRKGISMHDIKNIVRRRWSPERYILTREDTNDSGVRVNPHYNILITTRKLLKTSNSNNLNMDVQLQLDGQRGLSRIIDYCFKQYMREKRCIKDKHFYAWKRR